MRLTIITMLQAAVVGLAASAGFAQDSGAQLDLGQPVGQAPAEEGGIFTAETFGDWDLRCMSVPEGAPERCNLYQLLSDTDGQPIAEINLFRLPAGGQAVAGANVIVPLETLLTQQLAITVNGGEPRAYAFSFCNAAGCVARIGLTEEDVQTFRRGLTASVRVVPAAAPDTQFLLDMSLAGFSAGYDRLQPIE